MANIDEIRKNRAKKLKAFEASGISAYPSETKKSHTAQEALDNFGKLSRSKKEIALAGRLMSLRQHGGLVFSNLEDASGQIQLMFKKNSIGEKGFKFFLDNFDIGDFIQVKGSLMKTKKGEKTLQVSDYKILAKSLLPLPEKWHGLKEVEERYRKRYLDLLFNEEVRDKFKKRSEIIKKLREFLHKEGFMEVETPVLQPIYGGAEAAPFKTHLKAQNLDLYLRIAPELYLKRLLVAGFEKVFEIGRCFRNEGIDKSHNPDFTMLEFYWAYANHKDMMKLVERMFEYVLKEVFGKKEIEYEGKKINFKTPWERIDYFDFFKKETGIALEDISKEGLEKKAKKMGIKTEKEDQKPQIADKIFKEKCRPKILQPTFVLHYPKGAFALSKEYNDKKLACFQLIAANWELVKVFTELNDPLEQEERFKEQEKYFKKGLKEAQRMDEDFVEALEHGMPPAAGLGMGVDRLAALLTDSRSLREIILFPTMKPKK